MDCDHKILDIYIYTYTLHIYIYYIIYIWSRKVESIYVWMYIYIYIEIHVIYIIHTCCLMVVYVMANQGNSGTIVERRKQIGFSTKIDVAGDFCSLGTDMIQNISIQKSLCTMGFSRPGFLDPGTCLTASISFIQHPKLGWNNNTTTTTVTATATATANIYINAIWLVMEGSLIFQF